ncbi:substrate-binding periplasmic protein [Pedobacter heparinus]|uniref:Extracellular solute-binding protein family 3 n=1 Tax=Pedobacter heparinus (strain ATCC 13125 / DSM 2366 / CIP 104194 / JCM 7457 / NBRC 12017 / NCIMB 9290 / NRRL B-14731 / HIM 762-3) TaxID=485917 RepID=C6Y1D0_PEDHD|nr:transporter substrate-binding domain-containing protein [Pedobacter heparinus]ACU02906.1 extracellular solute-binding protein family 3 [Pedobacter heparinus DSM 2366]
MVNKKVLKVGLDSAAPFPMHSDYNAENFQGFEVDLLGAITNHLGLAIEYEVSLWSTILEKLFKGELDIICSAVTVTASRQHILEFSNPYLHFRLCAVVGQEDTLNSLHHFKNKTIGVREATEAEKYVREQFPANNIVYAVTNKELYRKLASGKIDLLVDDSPIAGGFLQKNKKLKIGMFLPKTDSSYAIAMKKGDVQLKAQFNEVLRLLKENGTYHTIYKKWFSDIQF